MTYDPINAALAASVALPQPGAGLVSRAGKHSAARHQRAVHRIGKRKRKRGARMRSYEVARSRFDKARAEERARNYDFRIWMDDVVRALKAEQENLPGPVWMKGPFYLWAHSFWGRRQYTLRRLYLQELQFPAAVKILMKHWRKIQERKAQERAKLA